MIELKTFVEIADRHGISAAADSLGVSPATVSQRLAKLEERLGVVLFHRNSRHVSLTKEGVIYYERVLGILELMNEADLEIGGVGGQITGHLRVTLAEWILTRFILPKLPEFQAQYPNLTLEFLTVDRTVRWRAKRQCFIS